MRDREQQTRSCRTRALGAAFAAAAFAAALVGGAARVEAIPAFSREYKTECTTCHTIFPQRNEFGEAFEKNGFVWPGAAHKKPVPQTEEERKSAEFVGLSGIPKTLPISLSLNVSHLYNEKAEDDYDMKRYSAEIFASGALGGDKVGFWFNEGLGSQSGGPEGPSQLYFVGRDLVGPVDVRIGKMSPDLSLWKGSDHLAGRPLSMGASVDGFGMTTAQAAVEVVGEIGPRVEVVLGVNDRNNNLSKTATTPHSVNDYYGRVGVKVGGTDFRGNEPDVDLDKDSVWDFLYLTFGGFAYSGSTSLGDGVDHDLTRYGVEAGASYKKLLLMTGATFGTNNDGEAKEIGSTALSAEVNYVFGPKLAVALRYDRLEVDGLEDRTIITPAILYAPLQCFKLSLRVASETYTVDNTTATIAASFTF
jgi:hypothetical protein